MDGLEQFLTKLGASQSTSHADLLRYFGFFLTVIEGGAVTQARLKDCYHEAGLSLPSNLPDAIKKSRAFVETPDGLKFHRDARARVAALLPQAIVGTPAGKQEANGPDQDRRKNVMVVYGRDLALRSSISNFLRALHLNPIEWEEAIAKTRKATPDIREILDVAFDMAQAVIVVFSPDEEVSLREDLCTDPGDYESSGGFQSRPNVFIESGMALARDEKQTILLEIGHNRHASDLTGLHFLRLSNDAASKNALFHRLSTAGCDVLNKGNDWLGMDFPIPKPKARALAKRLGKVLSAEVATASGPPVKSRSQLPAMDRWLPAKRAKDLLVIGQNLNLVLRQRLFFEQKLKEGGKVRLLIVDPSDDVLIETMSRGVEEHDHTKPDFKAALETINYLRSKLSESKQSLIELRTMNYVPTLSFQVLDGKSKRGTILVELAPNRIAVPLRPHFILSADNADHKEWYDRFLDNCERMFSDGTHWSWA